MKKCPSQLRGCHGISKNSFTDCLCQLQNLCSHMFHISHLVFCSPAGLSHQLHVGQ